MPYHSLAEAHRRLMSQLPADSPYRQTECQGLTLALRQLWRDASDSSRTTDSLDTDEASTYRDAVPQEQPRERMSV